jgi:hypothetical protein
MATIYGVNDGDPATTGGRNICADIEPFRELIRSRDPLVGGFWTISATREDPKFGSEQNFEGVGFLTSITTEAFPAQFYFVEYPRRGKTSTFRVRGAHLFTRFSEADISMSPKEEIEFKINVMLKPSTCSDELLRRLFFNIRQLFDQGACSVDWSQMAEQLPQRPEEGSKWAAVVSFVRQMATR